MPKWEYKYIYTDTSGVTVQDQDSAFHDSLSAYLAAIGQEGWEMIIVLPEVDVPGLMKMMIFFKRKISE